MFPPPKKSKPEPEESIATVLTPVRVNEEKSGAINIIDLANLDSCSFIATDDLGKTNDDGTFEVMGRMDYSDVRGCNLMWEGLQ